MNTKGTGKHRKFTSLGDSIWKSSVGLIYKQGSIHGNKVKHVLVHAMDSGTKGETTIQIITKHGTNDIISAYPIK